MSYATRSEVNSIVRDIMAEIRSDIDHGHISPVVNGYVPAVIVARIGKNKFMVTWNYQPETANDGDIAIVPHPEDFTEAPHILAILKDGLFHRMLFS